MNDGLRKILIVDDDETTRWMVGKALERFRANLIFAESAAEAKRGIELHSELDLVVCDYHITWGRKTAFPFYAICVRGKCAYPFSSSPQQRKI